MPSSTVPLQKNHHPSALCTSPDSRVLNLTVTVKKNQCKICTGLKFCSTENISNFLTLWELSQKVFFPLRYSQLARGSILVPDQTWEALLQSVVLFDFYFSIVYVRDKFLRLQVFVLFYPFLFGISWTISSICLPHCLKIATENCSVLLFNNFHDGLLSQRKIQPHKPSVLLFSIL